MKAEILSENSLLECSDGELVKLTLEKNNDAYSELVRRWMNAVIHTAYSVTGNQFSAEDIAQEAFFGCWFKLSMLREADKFGAWVCRVAKNQALNFVTRTNRWESLDAIRSISSKGSSPEAALILKETKDQLRDAFEKLPAKMKKVAEMYYITGLSQKQIASALELPDSTVRRRLFDIRNKLRSELEKSGVIVNRTPMQNKERGIVMTQQFIDEVRGKIDALKELVQGIKSFHLGDDYRNSLTEAEKLVDSMDESDEKQDALIQLYYYQTFIDTSEEAFEKALNAAHKANDMATIRKLVLGGYHLNKVSDEKTKERIERVFSMFPELKEDGDFVFWYARQLMATGDYKEAKKQFTRVTELFEPTQSSYYPNAIGAVNFLNAKEKYAVTDDTHLKLYEGAHGMILEHKNGRVTMCGQPGFSSFNDYHDVVLNRVDWADVLAKVAAGKDHIYYTEDMKIGDKILSEDENMVFEMVADNETVSIKSGTFTNCRKFVQHGLRKQSGFTKEIWYCPNTGLVKVDFLWNEATESYELDEYAILGGSGLFPLEKGNYWTYKLANAPDSLVQHIEYIVEYMDGDAAYLSSFKILALKKQIGTT